MNGNSLARQFAGTGLAKGVAKNASKKCSESAAKSAAKNAAKNAVKNFTAEKQLFRIYHDCFHFGPGTLLATRFLDPFPGDPSDSDLAVSQALPQHSATHCRTYAAECAKGFHPLHSWCCSDENRHLP